jgi:retinol dehydrogenase-12
MFAKGSNDDLFGASRPYGSWSAYGNSKLALMHLTGEIQRRYADSSGLRSVCLHPGAVFTKVADKGLAGTGAIESFRKALSPVEAFFLLTPEEGAQTVLHCATQPQLSWGGYYVACAAEETNADARNAEVGGRLWKATEAWVDSGCPPAKSG